MTDSNYKRLGNSGGSHRPPQERRELQDRPPRPPKGKNKRPRPFVIESRWFQRWRSPPGWQPWTKYGAYRTSRERAEALARLRRSYARWTFVEFRDRC